MFKISNGGKVLIAGTRANHFETELLANPRLIFWHSNKPNFFTRKDLPKGTELVLFGRQLSHSQRSGIVGVAVKKGIQVYSPVLSPNEIKLILKQCLMGFVVCQDEQKEEKMEEPIVVKKKRLARGAVSNIVAQEANFLAENPKEEIERLFSLVQSRGVSTLKQSVSSAFYREKAKRPIVVSPPVEQEGLPGENDQKNVLSDFVEAVPKFVPILELATVAIAELLERSLRLEKDLAETREKLAKSEEDLVEAEKQLEVFASLKQLIAQIRS